MKKVVENNSDKSCDNSDESSSNISCNVSDTGLTIEVNEEKPTKNKKKVTTEEIRKVIEKNPLSSDDEKPTKNKKKYTTTEAIKHFNENIRFSSEDEKPIKNTLTKKRKKVV